MIENVEKILWFAELKLSKAETLNKSSKSHLMPCNQLPVLFWKSLTNFSACKAASVALSASPVSFLLLFELSAHFFVNLCRAGILKSDEKKRKTKDKTRHYALTIWCCLPSDANIHRYFHFRRLFPSHCSRRFARPLPCHPAPNH